MPDRHAGGIIGHQHKKFKNTIGMMTLLFYWKGIQAGLGPAILRLIFIMPMVQLLVLLAADYEVKDINIAVVQMANYLLLFAQAGRQSFPGLHLLHPGGLHPFYEEALRKVEKDEADVVLQIPALKKFGKGKQGAIVYGA